MNKVKNQNSGVELLEVKKSDKANLEQNRSTWLLLGFIFALGVLYAGLEITEFQAEDEKPAARTKLKDDIIVVVEEIPPLVIEKKVIPPPPQAKKIVDVIKVVEEDVEIEEQELVSVQDMSEYADVEDTDIVYVEPEVEEEQIFDVVEEQPEFPGGMKALAKYFKDNINYPRISRDNNSQGKTFVKFTVNTDGSIQDTEVIRSSGDIYLDKEAIRVIEAMPKWKPGRQLGKAVRVKFVLPVNFRLQ
ncbi:MAG: energy transducer TonB [Bacteroidaceae bacterium]|jgi:protein TonB|nr:energy transducer TonB [Bacteroidaceae bacterium]